MRGLHLFHWESFNTKKNHLDGKQVLLSEHLYSLNFTSLLKNLAHRLSRKSKGFGDPNKLIRFFNVYIELLLVSKTG